MVSHRVEDLKAFDVGVDLLKVLRETELVLVPVDVPGHIPKGHSVHLLRTVSGHIVRQIPCEDPELSLVACPVGKVHIPEEEHLVLVLGSGFRQCEVPSLNLAGLCREVGIELRENALRSNLVATWYGDKDIAPLFRRLKLVYSLGVGLCDLHSVRNHNVSDSGAVTDYIAPDSRSLVRSETGGFLLGDGKGRLAEGFLLLSPADDNLILSAGDVQRQPDKELGLGDALYLAGDTAEQELIGLKRSLFLKHTEPDLPPASASI